MSRASEYAANAARIIQAKGDAVAQGHIARGNVLGNTIATLGQQIPAAVQDVMRRNAEKRKTEQIQGILAKYPNDLGSAVNEIMVIDPTIGSQLGKQHMEARKLALEYQKAKRDADTVDRDFVARVLGSAKDQDGHEQGLLTLREAGFDVSKFNPQFDAARAQNFQRSSLSAKEQIELDKPKQWSTVPGQKIVEEGKDGAAARVIFENPYTLTPDQLADNERMAKAEERQAAAQAEAVRHNQIMERIGLMGAGRAEASAAEAARHNLAMEENARNTKSSRPVTSGDAGRVADLDTSLDDLVVLRGALTETKGSTGTGAAIGAGMPAWVTDITGWGTDPKKRQGVIDRVKQVIGKALEGGVLRKEDEIKYEKILPNIKDTAEVATSKLNGLETALKQRRSTFIDSLESAGYDTSRYPPEHKGAGPPPPPGTFSVKAPDGQTYTFPTQKAADDFKKAIGPRK